MATERRETNPYYQEWREGFENAKEVFYGLGIIDTMRQVAELLPKTKLEINVDADNVVQGTSPNLELLGEEKITIKNHGQKDEVITSKRNVLVIDVSHLTRYAGVRVRETCESTVPNQNFSGRVWTSGKEHSSRNGLLPDIKTGVLKFTEVDPQTSIHLSQILNS